MEFKRHSVEIQISEALALPFELAGPGKSGPYIIYNVCIIVEKKKKSTLGRMPTLKI